MATIAATRNTPDTVITVMGRSSTCGRTVAKRAFSVRANHPSCPRATERAWGKKAYDKAGVTTIATNSDAIRATMYASAKGVISRPSTPDRPKMGRNTRTMMIVAKTIDLRISSVASRTTSRFGRWSPSGLAAFSRSRRTTFSTSMIASSTRAPIAMAIPPSVMVLIVAPNARRTRIAAASDSGMADKVMAAARTFARNSSTITMTSRPPSRRAVTTLSTATSMKSAWRKMRRSIVMPRGSSRCRASSSRSRRPVNSIVLAPGCFCTPTMTAGLPLREPSPRLSAGPSRTSATSRISTERTPRKATTLSPISSGLRTLPMACSTYSCGPSV